MDSRLLTTPCQIVTVVAGSLDEYGDATRTSSTASTTCHLQQDQSSEQGGVIEQSRWRVYLPASVSLSGADHLVINGDSYNLTGDPWPVIRPTTGKVDHVECLAERVK